MSFQKQFPAIDSSSSSNNQNKRLKSCSSPDSMVTSTSTATQIGGVIGTTVTTTTTAAESTRSGILVDSQENGVRLVHALMACAEAIQQNNLTLAEALVKQIRCLAVSQAGAMRKVATYFAEALARWIYRLSPPQNQIDHSLSDTLQMHFYETCPYLKFAHFTANQAILEAFEVYDRWLRYQLQRLGSMVTPNVISLPLISSLLKKLEDIVPSSHNCDVPLVNRVDYQLIDISEDGSPLKFDKVCF